MNVTTLALSAPTAALLFSTGSIYRSLQRRKGGGDVGEGSNWVVPLLFGCAVAGFLLVRVAGGSGAPGGTSSPPLSVARYLVPYTFFLPAVALLSVRLLSGRWKQRLVLDSLITVVAVIPFTWYFILGPVAVHAGWSLATKVTYGAFPVCLLAVMFVVLLSAANWRVSSFWREGGAVPLALLAIALIDGAFSYAALHPGAISSSLIDSARILAYTVLALALSTVTTRSSTDSIGYTTLTYSAENARTLGTRDVWRYLLPFALIPAVVALVAYSAHEPTDPTVATGVYLSTAVLVELIFVHQFLSYRELISYSSRNARLESLAAADPVTGLPNHRSLVVTLDQELARSYRYAHECGLLFLDLDHFKSLNDTYGHQAGDAVLHEFGAVVRAALRATDTLGRWGGEEFFVLLPETNLDIGLEVAERVRLAVASHSFWAAGGTHITCSLGLATFPSHASDRDSLIQLADRAMYAAKHLGRNQIRTASDPALALAESEKNQAGGRDEGALIDMVEALSALVEARDQMTGLHVDAVANLTVRLAMALGLDTTQARLAGLAGRLHDIGKVSIPDAVLLKPSSLTPDEWSLMRTHPRTGATVVGRISALRPVAPIIRSHHERWDGQGYPDSLEGEAIPLAARILAVADAFSAITADRPYRTARSLEEAILELRRCAGTQFDPRVVEALAKVLLDDAAAPALIGPARR